MAEGIAAVMQWRNHRKGVFSPTDVQLALEWCNLASPAMLLAGTNQQRLALEDRVLLANTKRDALLETARILGSTRDISELFSAIMVHAKTLMEVERTTMFLVDHTRKVLYTMVADGLADGREITVPWDKGLAGACYQSKQVVNIRGGQAEARCVC